MSKQRTSRAKNLVGFWIYENLCTHKWLYVLFGVLCVISITLGFIVGFSRADNFSVSDLPDGILVALICKKIGGLSLFFSRFFAFLGILILVWILGIKPILSWLCLFVVAYQGFLLGVSSSILVSIFKFGGFLSMFFVYFPTRLLMLVAICIFSVQCMFCSHKQKLWGCSIFSSAFLKHSKGVLLVVVFLGTIACLMQSILLPCVSGAIFIGT